LAFLFAALTSNPVENVIRDRVALIELNHFYDDNGGLVFDQVIFYEWCDRTCRFNVRAWRLLKSPKQIPVRDQRRGRYVAIWHDGDILRHVDAPSFRETWTQYDPELAERKFLAKDKRQGLTKFVK